MFDPLTLEVLAHDRAVDIVDDASRFQLGRVLLRQRPLRTSGARVRIAHFVSHTVLGADPCRGAVHASPPAEPLQAEN